MSGTVAALVTATVAAFALAFLLDMTQERIAREEFGMVKKGEILYRFVEPK